MKKIIIKETETVDIDWLKPNPYNEYPMSNIEELATLIDANGMETDIEVLEDGIIVKGHRRRLANIKLGRTKVDVIIVRYESTEDMLTAMFNDNQTRKPSASIKYSEILLWQKIYAGRQGVPSNEQNLATDEGGATRDLIGKMLGISGNMVDDYLKVGTTKKELFELIDKNVLKISTAANLIEYIEKEHLPNRVDWQEQETYRIAEMLCLEFEGDFNEDPNDDEAMEALIKKYARKLSGRKKKLSDETVVPKAITPKPLLESHGDKEPDSTLNEVNDEDEHEEATIDHQSVQDDEPVVPANGDAVITPISEQASGVSDEWELCWLNKSTGDTKTYECIQEGCKYFKKRN